VGDCVRLQNPDAGSEPYLARLVALFEASDAALEPTGTVQWFYRASDTHLPRRERMATPRHVVFSSANTDDCPLAAVEDRCTIHEGPPPAAAPASTVRWKAALPACSAGSPAPIPLPGLRRACFIARTNTMPCAILCALFPGLTRRLRRRQRYRLVEALRREKCHDGHSAETRAPAQRWIAAVKAKANRSPRGLIMTRARRQAAMTPARTATLTIRASARNSAANRQRSRRTSRRRGRLVAAPNGPRR
jgi:hypothetical protein